MTGIFALPLSHLQMTTVAFPGLQRLLEHGAGVLGTTLDDALAACRPCHAGERRLPAGIGRLVAGGAIGAVVDHEENVVGRGVVRDRGQRPEVGEDRAVSVDHDHGFRLHQGKAQPDGRRQPHRAQHVEVRRLVIDGVKLLALGMPMLQMTSWSRRTGAIS